MPNESRVTPSAIEKLPEINLEKGPEVKDKADFFNAEKIKDLPAQKTNQPTVSAGVPFVLSEAKILQKKVEKILEEDLAQLYAELNPQEQASFRSLGESTAEKITGLLRQAKVKINEILSLIRQWLMSIKGVNKYFVEQEAKIKAGKLLKLREEK